MTSPRPRLFSWKDTATWPADWPGLDVDPDGIEMHLLAARFADEYDAVTAYHACRTADVSSYYAEGIRPASHSDLLQAAVDIFACGRFKEVSRADVEEAARVKPGGDDGMVYVVLDDRDLIYNSNHYLRYGSEYLQNIAMWLEGKHGRPYIQCLETLGAPTVFEVHIPLSWLTEKHFRNISEYMARMVLYDCRGRNADFTLVFGRAVPPEFIRSHTHPKIG